MDDAMYTDDELRLTTERCRKYQGTAKINISQITPHPSASQDLDQKNVERLCEVFDKEGCRRLDVYNHVSAVVSRQHLHNALRAARVSAADLMTDQPNRYPHLEFSVGQVECLHGQHRLKAGKDYLSTIDQWWAVDLYLDDISPDLQTSLVDEYSNEGVPSDGQIYRKVRQYRYEANAHFENRWLARLSDNKARRLRGLESHPSVRAALDSLLAVPALVVHGMQIGSLPQALAMCCDEEIIHGLSELRRFWSSLVKQDRVKMLKVDVYTVERLQLLAPGVSSKDRTKVKGLVHSGEVFSSFTASERASIWKQMKKKKGIIPSLHTFFKDLWYLESCANCMKRLIMPNKPFPTIKSAMRAAFLPLDPADAQFLIQTSETAFRPYSHSQADPAELGYRQLWLYAMRHYPKLSKERQKKDHTARPAGEVDQMILYDMAVLARRLGFKSTQVEQLIQQSPDRQIARDALLRARRPDCYRYDEGDFDSLVNRVTECFLKAIPLNYQPPAQCVGGSEIKKASRCGHPQTNAQLQDRRFLFIDQIHGDLVPSVEKVSSFFVRRSVYFTFFSELSIPGVDDATGESPNHDVPMSPLFVPSDPLPEDEQVGESVDARSQRAGSPERQRLKDARRERRQQKRDKKLRKQQQREHQSSRGQPHSRSHSGNRATPAPVPDMETTHTDSIVIEEGRSEINQLETEPERDQLQGELGESAATGESQTDVNMEEPAREQEGVAADSAEELSPAGEAAKTPEILEERGTAISHTDSIVIEEERAESNQLETEPERDQLQGELGERAATGESQTDVNMEEPAREQEGVAADGAEELSPADEAAKTLEILEGRGTGTPAEGQGPSRIVSSKRAALKERAKWKPYDEAQRQRRRGRRLSNPPPQETLEQQINTLLQPREMAFQEQSTRPVTRIDFLEAQLRAQPETNEEQSPGPDTGEGDEDLNRQKSPGISHSTSTNAALPSRTPGLDGPEVIETPVGVVAATPNPTILASQFAQTPDPQDRPPHVPGAASGSSEAEIEHQLEIPRLLAQQPRRHGMVITRSEPQGRSPEPVPTEGSPQVPVMADTAQQETAAQSEPVMITRPEPQGRSPESAPADGSPQVHVMADAAQQETVTQSDPLLSSRADVQAPEASPSQTDTHTRTEAARIEQLPGEQDGLGNSQRPKARKHRGEGDGEKPRAATRPTDVTITFRARDKNGEWRYVIHQMVVDPSDPSPVERMAKKNARERKATFYDQNLRAIPPAKCFDAAIEDGTNTVFVTFGNDLAINKDTMESIERALQSDRGSDHDRPAKRRP